jgi:hypothetical protein
VPQSSKHLIVGSTENYSGKSATILGIARQLQAQGWDIAYSKPLETLTSDCHNHRDGDVAFLGHTLGLSSQRLQPPLVCVETENVRANLRSLKERLSGVDVTDYSDKLQQTLAGYECDWLLVEAAGTLETGGLFGLTLPQMAHAIDAPVLLVTRFQPLHTVEALLQASQQLGDRLIGVCINDIPTEAMDLVQDSIKPFLENHQIPVLGMLPRHRVLRSISVGELVYQLHAKVLCCEERLDLLVESQQIGAMGVNLAMRYFHAGHNMAIVTGGDRMDLHLAALEASTHCLILTGNIQPSDMVLRRAEDVEVPVLSVAYDTLQTVSYLERAFERLRLRNAAKVECICHLIAKHFDLNTLLQVTTSI